MEYLRSIKQSELVIDHPGLETTLPARPEAAQLAITTPIAIGSVRGAQVVACTITPEEGGALFQAVAKIYDPLYYSFEFDFSHQPQDTVWQAESEHSREAAAYEHLQNNECSQASAPAYFGSWTFSLPITSRGVLVTRAIHMILIERIEGTTIREMRVRNDPDPDEDDDTFHYPKDYRLEVLAMTMDHYVRMLHSGLDQVDFADRNIMLATNANPPAEVPMISSLPLPRIVLIDYNMSVVHSLTVQGKHRHSSLPLPVNPMQLWWGIPLYEFTGWVPHEWHETPRLKREWLKQRFGGDGQRRLYTIEEEPEF